MTEAQRKEEGPKFDSQVLDQAGHFTVPWYRWLVRKPAESSEKEIANGSTLTIPQRIGRTPRWAGVYLVCKAADLGYPEGRRVWLAGFEEAASFGVSISADLENLYVTVGASGIRLMQLSGSVGTFAAITNDSWRLVAVAE